MERIRVVTDSSSGISLNKAKELGVDVVPMPIIINGNEYQDGVTLFYDEAVAHLLKGDVMKTSQPSPREVIEVWERNLEIAERILYIPISSGISGSCVNAYTLAQNYNGRVVVVDNKSVECLLYNNVLEAVEMVKNGYSCEEIKDILEADFKDNFCAIIPEDLTVLKRGGRITPAAAAVASLLKINPIIAFGLGILDLYDKVRTFKKAQSMAMKAALTIDSDIDNYYWCVIGVGYSEEEQAEFVKEFNETIGKEAAVYYNFSPIVMSHTGNRTIGFGRVKKHKIVNKL